jgi:glycosyltransferase involved in cell wall biosynthesis
VDELDVHRFLPFPRARHVFSLEEHDGVNIPFLLRQTDGYCEAITANTPDVLERVQAIARQPFIPLAAPYKIAKRFFECPPPRPIEDRPIEVCFVGRLEAIQKRAHWLPAIIAGCAKRGARLRWHIYGDGPLKDRLARRVAANGCAADVQFHGWMGSADLAARLPDHDIFFLCSRWEGLPVAMVEAMLCGLACVVPAIPAGITYALKQGGGLPYPAVNPRVAASVLCACSKSPAALYHAKVQAQHAARSLFGEQTALKDLERLESELQNLRFNGRVLNPETSQPLRSVPAPVYLRRMLLKPFKWVQTYSR